MKAVLERIEYNWWNFHIKVLDESQWIREILPKVQGIWEMRDEATDPGFSRGCAARDPDYLYKIVPIEF